MTYQYVSVSISGSSGIRLKFRPSSLVTHAIVTMTRLASTDKIWKANSKACQGASNLYGLQHGISIFVNEEGKLCKAHFKSIPTRTTDSQSLSRFQ